VPKTEAITSLAVNAIALVFLKEARPPLLLSQLAGRDLLPGKVYARRPRQPTDPEAVELDCQPSLAFVFLALLKFLVHQF